MNQRNNLINPTETQPRGIHTTSRTPHPGLQKRQKGEWEKPRAEGNIVGARNTMPENSRGSATSQKITARGPVHHKSVEERLRHQARETATRS